MPIDELYLELICSLKLFSLTLQGGIQSVVWSNLFQALAMITGLVAIIVRGSGLAGGMRRFQKAIIRSQQLLSRSLKSLLNQAESFFFKTRALFWKMNQLIANGAVAQTVLGSFQRGEIINEK